VAIVAGDRVNAVLVLVKSARPGAFLLMARRTHRDDLASRRFRRVENVALAVGLDVLTTRAVTHLAAFDRRHILRALDSGKVGRAREIIIKLRVTGSTSIRADKIRRLGLLRRNLLGIAE
jgi:hypothetical protein